MLRRDVVDWLCDHHGNTPRISDTDQHNMIFPIDGRGPLPHPDLDEKPEETFRNARNIIPISPGSATERMRLCVDQLLRYQLEIDGRDLNARIANLAQRGVDPRVIAGLDVVRITGADGTHDLETMDAEHPDTPENLMKIVNILVEKLDTERRLIVEVYDRIPETKKEAIDKRDGNQTPS